MKTQRHNLTGQVLLFSLLLLSGAVIIAFSLSTIYIRDIRLSTEAVSSLKAFYFADRASEENLYNYVKYGEKIDGKCDIPEYPYEYPHKEGEYETIKCDTEGIITTGYYDSTSRSIEVNFD
jgi:hypothetical protein